MDLMAQNASALVWAVGLAAVLTAAWTVYRQFCGLGKKSRPAHIWVIAVLALLTLLVGGVTMLREGEARDLEIREDLLRHAQDLSLMFPAEEIRKLSLSARDNTNAAFQCLGAQLSAYAKAVGHRRIHTEALREGRIVSGPDSLGPPDPLASPPGTPRRQPTAANRELFRSGAAITQGPVGDEHGLWVSALAPVKDARTGEVLMAVGLDVEWLECCRDIARARLPAVTLTWMVLLVLAAGGEVLRRQRRTDGPLGRTAPWVESMAAAGIGLAVTLAAALWAHAIEGKLFRSAFAHLAEARGKILIDSLADVRDLRLKGLAGFIQASPEVTRRQFRQYVAPLAGDAFVQAWEWVPAVPAAARVQFEAEARRAGLPDFVIYEKDALGHRVPPASRPCYYPAFFVEPATGNEGALGLDLGSETLRRTALEQAARAETAIATDPIRLVRGAGTEKGVLVCHPVFTETEPRRLRGFALLVLRLQTMLHAALEKTGHDRTVVVVDLLQLFPDQEPMIIASSLAGTNLPAAVAIHGLPAGDASIPFFAFGKAYVLAMAPGPAFLSAYPRRSAWLVLLVGVVATIGMAALVGVLSNNRNYLKRQIETRTARLNQSEARLRTITDSAHDAILMMTPEGAISYWNPAAERIFGYTSAEALGQPLHSFLVPPRYHSAHQAALPEFGRTGQGAVVGKTTDLAGRRKDGQEISLQLALSTVQVEGRWHAVGILRDITERKRTEDEVRRQAGLISSLLDSVPDIVFFKNIEGVYLGCNPACVELVGRPRSEIIGKTDHDLFDQETADSFRAQDQRMLAGREPLHKAEWSTYPDGRKALLDTLKRPIGAPTENSSGCWELAATSPSPRPPR